MDIQNWKNLHTNIITYEIAPCVPQDYLTYTNKENYEKVASTYREKYKRKYKDYLRYIVKKDLFYCLRIQIKYQHDHFIKKQKIKYKKTRFSCIYDYLQYMCDLYSSEKCKQLIKETYQIKSIECNKKYKKYRTYKNKWSN